MAAAIDDSRFGLHRALRKIRQDFSRATPRSTGARAAESARLTVCWRIQERLGRLSPIEFEEKHYTKQATAEPTNLKPRQPALTS